MDYSRFTQLAIDQIADKGRDVVLIKRNISGYDPITATLTDGADTSATVKALFTDYSARDIDGEIILRGDKRCLIAGSVDDYEFIMDGADQYTIVNIEAVQPGETMILCKVQVRR